VTYDLTISVARTLAKLNPAMTFIYVSGAGTDSSERGRMMWARVKGKTENALLPMPFKAVFMFRPGYIQPLHGGSDKDEVVRRSLRDDGAPLSSMEVAFLEVRDNDGMRRARDAERGQAGCL
jgi:hypothetical protein